MAIIKKDNSHNPFKVDEGMYKAVIASIDEKDGRNGTYLLWNFKLLHATVDGEPVQDASVAGFTPLIIQDDTKLDKWLRACGVAVEQDGDEFDTEDLIGRKVQVFVENKVDKKSGQEKSQAAKVLRYQPEGTSSQASKKTQEKPQERPKSSTSKPASRPASRKPDEDPVDEPPVKKSAAPQQKTKKPPVEEEEVEGEGDETRPDTDDPSLWQFDEEEEGI